MKKLLLIAVATLVCVSAFAQGKLQFVNDSTRVVYFTSDTAKLNAADASKANNALTSALIGSLDGAPALKVTLWGGTTSGNLSLQTTITTWSPSAGRWTSTSVALNSPLAGGTMAYFQIQIYDGRATSAADAWTHLGWYAGSSEVFTAIPQIATYSPINDPAGAAASTWAVGTHTGLINAATSKGAIEVWATVPEPGTLALAGLGLASLLIFRRRK